MMRMIFGAGVSLAALVATLWYQTIATDRLRATAITAASVYEDLLRLVRTRNDVGQVGAQDVALAGADLDRARERERAFAASLQQITRSLEVMLGRYPAAELQLAPSLPPVPAPVPDGLPSELFERRPDLVAAERRVASAFHAVQSAKAARLPRFALTAGGGRSTSELIRLIGAGAGFWRAGVEVFALPAAEFPQYRMAFGLWKGDQTLKRAVAAAIGTLERSGELARLADRYGTEG